MKRRGTLHRFITGLIGTISYGVCCAAYAVLAALLLSSCRGRMQGALLVFGATVMTATLENSTGKIKRLLDQLRGRAAFLAQTGQIQLGSYCAQWS